MSSGWYSKALEAFAQAGVDWNTDTIKVDLVRTADYTVNLSSDQYHSTVTASGGIAATATLSGQTSTGGKLDALDAAFGAVATTTACVLVVWKDTGVDGTSPLLLYIDTGTGLPYTPNGASVTVQWPSTGDLIGSL